MIAPRDGASDPRIRLLAHMHITPTGGRCRSRGSVGWTSAFARTSIPSAFVDLPRSYTASMPELDYVVSAQGVRSPRILYGTAWKKLRTEALVSEAVATGFRGIDTACQPKHYNEAGVGAAVAASLRSGLEREQLYLQT